MNPLLQNAAGWLMRSSPLGLFPVRVRSGVAAGARWTLYPWTSYWRGTHEPSLQGALISLGGGDIAGWSCWDLGAHFGLYSIGLARRVGPRGQVAAFEPNPVSFARLKRHRDMNQVTWLHLYAAAVSDQGGVAELFTYGDLTTTTTHLPYEGEPRLAHVVPLAVPTLRLDDLVKRGELRLPRFVKIDVEGHGHRALAGMRETLAAARPIILAGFHSPSEVAGIMNVLPALGYRWREVSGTAVDPEVQVGGDYLFTPPN
jgi:FkbM family methyltransferase